MIMYVKQLVCDSRRAVLGSFKTLSSFSYHVVLLVFSSPCLTLCWPSLFPSPNKALLKILSLPPMFSFGKFTHFYLSKHPSKKL